MMGGLRQATKLLGNSRYAIGDVISAAFGVPTKREFRKICLDCVQLLVERPVCVCCRRSVGRVDEEQQLLDNRLLG